MVELSTDVEQKIIDAAISSIEIYGLEGTTSRRIAEIAGVNGAAINYYFRSKEILIQRVTQKTLENAFDWSNFAQKPANSPQDKCVNIFENLIQGACQYPGMTRFHFNKILNGENASLTQEKFSEFFGELFESIQKEGLNLSEEELKLAITEITASALMAALVPTLFEKSLGINLEDEETRKLFLNRLVNKLL